MGWERGKGKEKEKNKKEMMRIEEAIKVLHDFQKYRRDLHVPAKYSMPDPKRIGEAIDCAIHNLRTCVQVSRVVEAYEGVNKSIEEQNVF